MQVKILELNGQLQEPVPASVRKSRQARGSAIPEGGHTTNLMIAQGRVKDLSPRELNNTSEPTGMLDSQRTTQVAPRETEDASSYMNNGSFVLNLPSKIEVPELRQIVSSRADLAVMETSKSVDDLSLALAAGEAALGHIVASRLDSSSDVMMATHETMNLNQDLDILDGLQSMSHVKDPPQVQSSARATPRSLANDASLNFLVSAKQ